MFRRLKAARDVLSGRMPTGEYGGFTAPSGTFVPFLGTDLLASGEETMPRPWVIPPGRSLTNQLLTLSFWTARKTEPITQVRVPTYSSAAGATPTLCRVGIYSIDGAGAGTLVASLASDTTLWAAANTDYLRSLSAPFNKVAGQRYAFGWLCVTAAAIPSIPGVLVGGGNTPGMNASARPPRLGATLSGQADLPASFADASLGTSGAMLYAELVP